MQESDVHRIVQNTLIQSRSQAGYGLSLIPYHNHDGVNSPRVRQYLIVNHTLYGATAATSGNYSAFFTTPFPMTIVRVTEVHTTAGSDAGAVTLNLERLTGAAAPGGGVSILAATFNLKGTANTVQVGSLATSSSTNNTYMSFDSSGNPDRLALVLSGTPTALTDVSVTITFLT